jgi:dihydroorotase
MLPSFLFRNGRIIDPAQGLDGTADVLVLDGRLAEIGARLGLSADRRVQVEEIDLTGKWIVPGLLDIHVHLREPGEEHKETIATGTASATAGGYVAVACMPNTRPVNDCAAVTEFIIERARTQGSCRVFPVGAISMGLAGEQLTFFGELRDAGAVAVSDDGRPVMNSMLMRRAMESARSVDLPVISHAEDLNLSHGGVMNEGAVATKLGLRGIPNAAEEVMVARDLLLAEMTQSRLHFAHVSTAGSVRLIRQAKQRGLGVTAETAPQYFTLTENELETFDTVYKVNPPLRSLADVEAVKLGLADGTIDAIATDHAPHTALEKDTELGFAASGMIGLESAVPLILNLVREGVLSPLEAIAKVTCNPAAILGVPLGAMLPGLPADLTIIDPQEAYVLDCHTFRSKSRNCPFHGRNMQGRVFMTLVEGRVTFARSC